VDQDLYKEVTELIWEDLRSVFLGERLVVHWKRAFPEDFCERQDAKFGALSANPYANVPSVTRVGPALVESRRDPQARMQYFESAPELMTRMRRACWPEATATGLIRLLLDEIAPAGASLARFEGKTCFCGLIRTFGDGSESRPHVDRLWRDLPGRPEAPQVAINVYSEVGSEGGELCAWRLHLNDEEFRRLQSPPFGIDWHKLPPPDVVVRPQKGDCVVVRADMPHAVRVIRGELPRRSAGMFAVYRGDDRPLELYS
jgi:hypothetical protein